MSLVAGGALLNQNVLQGSLAENPRMAAGLIQEVRSYEAFWRKQSRGEGICAVAVVGLGPELGESLRATVGVALPGAQVELILIRKRLQRVAAGNGWRVVSRRACFHST